MSAASIVTVGQILLVTLQDEVDATEASDLLELVGNAVAHSTALGVLIDISALTLVDSFMARTLGSVLGMVRLLGADGIVAGIRPEVAIAMVELGADMPAVATAISVDQGLSSLQSRIRQRR